MIILVILISFLLEGILSNLLSDISFLIPLFTIISLIILYPYFNGDKKNFLFASLILGIIYDIVYTNCIFTNAFTFVIISILIILIYNYITVNTTNISLINTILLLVYQIINYFILCLTRYTTFNENTFIAGLYSVLILNLIYGFILFLVTSFFSKKYRIRKLS